MTRLLSESWKSSRRRLAAASTKSSTLALLAALSLLVSCVVSSGLLDDAVNVRAVKTFWAISLARERRNDYQGASAAVSAALAEALRYESSEEGGGFLLEGAIKDVAQNDTAIKRIMDEFEKETSRRLHVTRLLRVPQKAGANASQAGGQGLMRPEIHFVSPPGGAGGRRRVHCDLAGTRRASSTGYVSAIEL